MDELHWTQIALDDLEAIGAYIATDSPKAAERIIRRIVETAAALSYHPRMGQKDANGRTHRLLVTGTPYVIIYRLRETVDILTIFHAARRPMTDFPDR